MEKSESIAELAGALAKAQGEMSGSEKDAKNPFFHSAYSSMASVWSACRKQLAANGLSVIQCPEDSEAGVTVETVLCHSSGEFISSKYFMPVAKPDAQSIGSAITYARRYALAAIVGIAPHDDDDGNAASGNATDPKTQRATTKVAAPKPKAEAHAQATTRPKPLTAPVREYQPPVTVSSDEIDLYAAQVEGDTDTDDDGQGTADDAQDFFESGVLCRGMVTKVATKEGESAKGPWEKTTFVIEPPVGAEVTCSTFAKASHFSLRSYNEIEKQVVWFMAIEGKEFPRNSGKFPLELDDICLEPMKDEGEP